MLLDLVGGAMNERASWSATLAELEQLGFAHDVAKHLAGVPPQFDLDGRWVMLVDDEPLDAAHNAVIDISGAEATSSDGRRGMVIRTEKRALVRFPAGTSGYEECVTITTVSSDDALMGMVYTARHLPEGDPSSLWRALEEAGESGPLADDDLPMSDVAWLYRAETMDNQPAT